MIKALVTLARTVGQSGYVLVFVFVVGCTASPGVPPSVRPELTPTGQLQAPRVSIRFSPVSWGSEEAAREYQAVWDAEGDRIVDAMEGVSGLKFVETRIEAIVYEGISRSGSQNSPMMMRASYPAATKKATLIHELGHRFISQLKRRPRDLDEHRVLFLVLYDIWLKLYGKGFADEQVDVEQARRGVYDYRAAWEWALSLNEGQRAARFKGIATANRGGVD